MNRLLHLIFEDYILNTRFYFLNVIRDVIYMGLKLLIIRPLVSCVVISQYEYKGDEYL